MRSRHIVLLWMALSALSVSRAAVAEDRPKRVLILDSFARGVAPNSEYIGAFRAELRHRWPGPLDLFEVSLESARSSNPDDDENVVNFLGRVDCAIRWIWSWSSRYQPCGLPRAIGSDYFPMFRC